MATTGNEWPVAVSMGTGAKEILIYMQFRGTNMSFLPPKQKCRKYVLPKDLWWVGGCAFDIVIWPGRRWNWGHKYFRDIKWNGERISIFRSHFYGFRFKEHRCNPQLWVAGLEQGFRGWVLLKATIFPITVLTTCKYPRMDDVLSGWGWFELYNSLWVAWHLVCFLYISWVGYLAFNLPLCMGYKRHICEWTNIL